MGSKRQRQYLGHQIVEKPGCANLTHGESVADVFAANAPIFFINLFSESHMPDSSPSHFFTLTDAEAACCFPLPGRCLLRTSPAELKVGSVYLPEDAAEAHERVKAARVGVVVRCNERKDKYVKTQWDGEDLKRLKPGAKVVYLGHQDEMDNAYVVVRHGQILAVLEEQQ